METAQSFESQNPVVSAAKGTPHTCQLIVKNNTASRLDRLLILRTFGEVANYIYVDKMDPKTESGPILLHYETGPNTPSDLWTGAFSIFNVGYFSVVSMKCNIKAEDANQTVVAEINGSGEKYTLKIKPPHSSPCEWPMPINAG